MAQSKVSSVLFQRENNVQTPLPFLPVWMHTHTIRSKPDSFLSRRVPKTVCVCVCLAIQYITLRTCVCYCWQWPREWACFPNPLLKRTAASSRHIKHTDFRRWNVNGLIICRKLCWWGSFWSAGSVSKVTVLEPNPTETEVRSKLLQNFLFVFCFLSDAMLKI